MALGEPVSYATMGEGRALMELTGKTNLYGILAHPAAHVRAPMFINPVFEKYGLDAFLVVLHVHPDDLEATVPALQKVRNLKGLILTIPHKPALARMCDELGPNGKLMRAVNTVRFEPDGRLAGEMFDGVGFIRGALESGIELEGRRILLVGAGGAGQAIAFALAQHGAAEVTIANRTRETADDLVARIRDGVPGAESRVGDADPAGYEVVVNATSLGLKPDDPLPFDPARVDQDAAVIDIIAPKTRLQEEVAARGLKLMGGRPMIDTQVVSQLQFLGELPPDTA